MLLIHLKKNGKIWHMLCSIRSSSYDFLKMHIVKNQTTKWLDHCLFHLNPDFPLFFFFSDGLPIILSANIDGYIPLKFEPKSTLFIGGVSAPSSDDTISISSLASSSLQPQSPLNDKKPVTDLSVTGPAMAAPNGPATRC